ncbi:TIGR01244 family protein [Limimonas halophila]|uniref:TIGR01244 family protein n=1 Tax=Limimonas halophila TaxID=1082479 RepID=A0A1G7P996_9PROT|nr:TIGR01244 family sulfur transferase [Limimonas halophila]SDF82774.1 TIGR01244 family protein [Limimonas halophila]
MLDPKWLSQQVAACGQIDRNEIVDARQRGFVAIVNNRPDGEGGPTQPDATSNKALAGQHGLSYHHLPLATVQDLTPELIDQMADALANADGTVLVHCKTGGRSALLWALVQVRHHGRKIEDVLNDTEKAGFELGGTRPLLEKFAAA